MYFLTAYFLFSYTEELLEKKNHLSMSTALSNVSLSRVLEAPRKHCSSVGINTCSISLINKEKKHHMRISMSKIKLAVSFRWERT